MKQIDPTQGDLVLQGYAQYDSGRETSLVAVITNTCNGRDGTSFLANETQIQESLEGTLTYGNRKLYSKALEGMHEIQANPDEYQKLQTISQVNDFLTDKGKLGQLPEGNQPYDGGSRCPIPSIIKM